MLTTPTAWSELIDLAILADKYCCVTSVSFYLRTWMQTMPGPSLKEQLTLDVAPPEWFQAVVSYIIRDDLEFGEATWKLVINHQGSFLCLTKRPGFNFCVCSA